ncbi:MAG: hypothetical protein ACOYD7_06760 [Raoultibacter sp.]
MFKGLGAYEDAEARAASCILAAPETGELYHNEGFVSSSTDIVFEAGAIPYARYIKIYSGDAHVSSVFIHPNSSTTIHVPAGDYTFKSASGELWFGETDMFGSDGDYYMFVFDGSNEVTHLDDNKIYTISLSTEGGGNVGGKTVDRSSF